MPKSEIDAFNPLGETVHAALVPTFLIFSGESHRDRNARDVLWQPTMSSCCPIELAVWASLQSESTRCKKSILSWICTPKGNKHGSRKVEWIAWIVEYHTSLCSTTNENLRDMFFHFISGNLISRFHADVQKWQVSSMKLLTPATHRCCLRADSVFESRWP